MNNFERQHQGFLKSANDQYERDNLKRSDFLQLCVLARFAFGLYGLECRNNPPWPQRSRYQTT